MAMSGVCKSGESLKGESGTHLWKGLRVPNDGNGVRVAKKSTATPDCAHGTVTKFYWRSISRDALAETDSSASTTAHTERLQTTSCPPNYKFTGYERDPETGLDYAFT